MSAKISGLIKQFLNEGLIGGESTPPEVAKLDQNIPQNLSAEPQPIAPVQPTATDTSVPEPEKPAVEGVEDIEAAKSGLLLASYHLEKFMGGLSEGEDIDLEKLRGTKQMLLDARKVLDGYKKKPEVQEVPAQKPAV